MEWSAWALYECMYTIVYLFVILQQTVGSQIQNKVNKVDDFSLDIEFDGDNVMKLTGDDGVVLTFHRQ